jgi:hypothetical protein
MFDTWWFHAFFTTSTLDTVTADETRRGHAIIEQVHADLKNSALAQLPSKLFAANAAWLVLTVIAFKLTRAAARPFRSQKQEKPADGGSVTPKPRPPATSRSTTRNHGQLKDRSVDSGSVVQGAARPPWGSKMCSG